MRWPMSHPRASAFICLHLPASALDAFLLSLPRAAPCGKVARPPPASQNQLHREMPAEMAGLTHPRFMRGGDTPCPAVRPRRHLPAFGERHTERGKKPMHQFGAARRWREATALQGTSGSAPVGPATIGLWHGGKSPCSTTGQRGWQQAGPMRSVAIPPHVQRCGLTGAAAAEPSGRDAQQTPHAQRAVCPAGAAHRLTRSEMRR